MKKRPVWMSILRRLEDEVKNEKGEVNAEFAKKGEGGTKEDA